jgi:hypothetical protein
MQFTPHTWRPIFTSAAPDLRIDGQPRAREKIPEHLKNLDYKGDPIEKPSVGGVPVGECTVFAQTQKEVLIGIRIVAG